MKRNKIKYIILVMAIFFVTILIALQNVKQTETNISYGMQDISNDETNKNDLLYNEISNNYIENKASGIKILYLDENDESEISVPEKISGKIGTEYDLKNFEKNINNYELIKTDGEEQGRLTKEKICIKYIYGKTKTVNVNYIEESTNKKIKESMQIKSFIGKESLIQAPRIDGYSYNNIKEETEDTINFYYNKNISIPKKESEEKVIEEKNDIEEKQMSKITIISKDIESDKILRKDEFTGEKGKKIKIILKRIEGYRLITDNFNNESDNNKKKNEESIIDELLSNISKNSKDSLKNSKDINKKDNVKTEYEIVMNCDDSEYIIYYKK